MKRTEIFGSSSLALLLVVTLLLVTGCGAEPNEAPAGSPVKAPTPSVQAIPATASDAGPDAEAGKAVYFKHCHYCHGREGRGDGPVTMQVEPKPINFVTDTERMNASDAELLDSISTGINKETGGFGVQFEKKLLMPPFKGILTEKEHVDVLAFIRELRRIGQEKDLGKR